MNRSALAPAVLALSLLPAAHAISAADTTLSDFRITLTDLDEGDGVAPSIAFDPISRSTALTVVLARGVDQYDWQQYGTSAFGPVSSSGMVDGVGGLASIAGDPMSAGATLSAHAEGVPGGAEAIGQASVETDDGPMGNTLVLSPQTQVTFSGLASTTWNASQPRAAAYGEVAMWLFEPLGAEEVGLSAVDFVDGWGAGSNDSLTGSTSWQASVTFRNATDAAVTLQYDVLATARASEVLVPPPSPPGVDEPGAAWLLLAGALPLAWRSRRRTG